MEKYQLWIAQRYLRVRSREFFISAISWISVAGVAVGVAALIVVMSVMAGFETEIKDKVLGANAHGRILPAEGRALQNWKETAVKARAFPGVKSAEPYIESRVMLMTDRSVQGVELKGFWPETPGGPSISRYLVGAETGFIKGGSRPGLFVGREMADNLGLKPGDLVRLVSPDGQVTPAGATPRIKVFRVAGVFMTGMYEYDLGRVYADIGEAADFLRYGQGVSGVEVSLDDIYAAGEKMAAIGNALGQEVRVRDWTEMNKSLFGALQLEKMAMYLILGLIVLVAAFNIASTLTMVVMEKAKEIGILKSMGMTRSGIRNIFLLEGAVIGVLGAVAGAAAGTGLALALKKFEFISLPQDVYYNASLPVLLDPLFVAGAGTFSVLLCILAACYPSWQAAGLDPVETLRYE